VNVAVYRGAPTTAAAPPVAAALTGARRSVAARRTIALSALLWVALIMAALGACAARAEGWRSAQPPPPPPPEGESAVGVPVALGHIGQISFWAPNRGLLITAGTETVPAGLYYYNGVLWRELSTVCGGADGRIAWAGPDDFWTISDQQAGQQLATNSEQQDRSLCHFENGRVVASYAEPLGVPDSYQRMDAAACSEPNDCWFGGERLPVGVNSGAFHLHWNGHTLTPVPSLQSAEPALEDPAQNVTDIAFYRGHFYESVLNEGGEGASPFPLHKIVEAASNPFVPLLPEGPPAQAPTRPEEREPFTYKGPGALRFSADARGLWAIAGEGPPILLLLGASGQFQQAPLGNLGGEVAGIAAEPGGEDAWVSLRGEGSGGAASLAQIQADGSVVATAQLPEGRELASARGTAGAIACPAPEDCWLATSEGWLFHLGGSQPEDDDPNFQSLITYRPPDASIPFAAPEEEFPEDDSGAQVAPSLPSEVKAPPSPAVPRAHEPLFSRVHSRLLDGTTLALTFTLATRSHVRLLAQRHRRTVAATPRRVLPRGRHTLKLRLSRRAWPTRLDLQVNAIGAIPLQPSGGGATGGPTVIATSLRRPVAPQSAPRAAAPSATGLSSSPAVASLVPELAPPPA
jgi:hypothetical protein